MFHPPQSPFTCLRFPYLVLSLPVLFWRLCSFFIVLNFASFLWSVILYSVLFVIFTAVITLLSIYSYCLLLGLFQSVSSFPPLIFLGLVLVLSLGFSFFFSFSSFFVLWSSASFLFTPSTCESESKSSNNLKQLY